MDEDTSPQVKKRSPWQRAWLVVRTVGLIAGLPLLFAVVAALLMLGKNIDAPDWFTARIEARAAQMLQGGSVEFGNIFITVGRDLHPEVTLIDTIVRDGDGVQLARVPRVEGGISPRGLLFEGSVLMQNIVVSGAQIDLTRAADGSVALAFGGAKESNSAPSLTALLDQSDQIFDRPALAALETVTASNLVVNYADVRAGRSWTVDGGVISLDLSDNKTALRGDFNVLSGGAEFTRLTLNYSSLRGSRAASMAVQITDARARDIATQSDALRFLAEIDAPITAALRTSLDEAGTLGPLSATLELGRGVLQPNAATEPVPFDEAKAYLTYEPDSQLIRFDHVELQSPLGALTGRGRAYLRDLVDGVPQALVAQFTVPKARISAGSLYAEGMDLPPASVDLRLRFNPFRIEVGQFVSVDGDTHLALSGQVDATPEGWTVALDGQVDQTTPARLVALWPVSIKPKSRQWIVDNISGGQLRNATFNARAVQGAKPVVAVRFEFEGATARFMRTMPLLQDADGVGFIEENQLILSLDHGRVPAAQGGMVDLSGTTMVIHDTRVKGGDATVDLALAGSITSMLSLIDREPFQFISKGGQSVTMADGRAQLRGEISFPMRRGVPPNEVRYDLTARLRDVASDTIVKGRSLRASRLDLTVDNSEIAISGPMQLDGLALDASWRKTFGAQFAGRSQVRAQVPLSEQALDTFKIALPEGSVTGAGTADIVIDLTRDAPSKFELTSNLRGVGIALPAIGWSKGRNVAGALRVAGALGPVPQIDVLEVSGGGLQAKGQISLNDQGGLDRATFSEVRIGNWLNAPVTLRGRGRGRPVGVTLGAGAVDLRRARFGGGQSESGPIKLSLDRLQITEGIALTQFRGDFNGQGGFSGEFNGRLNGGPRIAGTVVPQGGRSAVRLRSDDAGGVAAAAGLITNAAGGSLDLTLLPAAGAGSVDGDLQVRNLRVRDAPAMASLLDAISVAGLLRQLDGQGLAFDEVEAKFRLTPTQVIVTQSSAVGPGLGISLDGIYTLASKQVDFQGVVSPLYILNGIGSILTRKGEGLIGFNFNLTGSAIAPNVSVNPLSALTPGMFREIFRRPAPEVSQ